MIEKWKNQLILGAKLLKFSFQMKTNMILLVVFLLFGILEDVTSKGAYIMGAYFLAITSMYISQFLNGLCISDMVQSSRYKKALLVDIPALYHVLITFAFYLILAGLRLVYGKVFGGMTHAMLAGLMLFCILSIIISCYNLLVYRKPVVGYAIIACMILGMIFSNSFSTNSFNEGQGTGLIGKFQQLPIFDSFPLTFWIGLLLIALDGVLFYGLSTALYKTPISYVIYKRVLANASRRGRR